ncbi:preprotein translocase subunit YajC [Modestobacter sp. I12A-02662]|uniref:preprotein translocase subunit YajC n=1 Tax=Modestobacter sp. I12A-02662 TaxID=1730496 RepID=UPI0034DFD80B
MEQLFPLVLLALAFVLLIVLPARQRKKMQAKAQALQESLTIGTPVMLTSGIHGTVAGLGEGTVDLQIAAGVVITVARPAVMEVRTPVGGPNASGNSTGFVDGDPTDPTR